MKKLKPKDKSLSRWCDLCGRVHTEKNLLPVSLPLYVHLLTGGFGIESVDLHICDDCSRRIARILGEYVEVRHEECFKRFAQWKENKK